MPNDIQEPSCGNCGILDEVQDGIRAIAPERLSKPPQNTRPRAPGEPSLGEADEYLKRFFWYLVDRGEEYAPLVAEHRRLRGELKGVFQLVGPNEMAPLALHPDDLPKIARLEEIQQMIERPFELLSALWFIFFAEARARNSDLKDCEHPIVCIDWTFSDAHYEPAQSESEEANGDGAPHRQSFFFRLPESNTPQ